MNFLRFVYFFVLVLLFHVPADAQDWVSFQSQQKINDLVDNGNELVMATDMGIVVMDKSSFSKTFLNTSNSNLPQNHIETITKGPNGNTWIGTYDVKLARFDGTDFQETIIPEGNINFNTFTLYDMKIAPNGDIWLGTNQGVFQRQGETWFQYMQDDLDDFLFDVWDIEINDAGEVFAASNYIYKFTNGEWTNISENSNILAYLDADLFFDSMGDLYLIGDLDKIGRYDGTSWEEYDNGGFNGSETIRLTEDADGNIYFNTRQNGIYQLENGTFQPISDPQASLFSNQTSFFYIDADDNRWLNSGIELSVGNGGDIQNTTISQYPIERNSIATVSKGDNGNMYFLPSNPQENITTVDTDGNWSVVPVSDFSTLMSAFFLRDILVLEDDDIWLAADNGLHHYDGNEWALVEQVSCKSFARDSEGKIYVLADGRIYIIDNMGAISEYNADNSSLSSLILSGHGVDADDNLWIASFTWEGENIIQKVSSDGVWTTYDGTDFPAINGPGGDFHFDMDGNVWLPLSNVGAVKFDGTDWINPFEENFGEFANYSVYSIKDDAAGKLYFSHQYGVTTWLDGEWGDLLINDVPHVNSIHGANIEFDDVGNLWWASNRYGVFARTVETSTSASDIDKVISDFRVYPNPALDYTTLDFSIQGESIVNVSIYNNLGQLQSSLNLGRVPEGNHRETIRLEHLSKGFYIIQIEVNDKLFTQKVIVQ